MGESTTFGSESSTSSWCSSKSARKYAFGSSLSERVDTVCASSTQPGRVRAVKPQGLVGERGHAQEGAHDRGRTRLVVLLRCVERRLGCVPRVER